MKINVFDTTGKKLTPLEVNTKDFGAKVNSDLLAQAIRIYTSNGHQKTSKVKTRGEVTGSTRKIYKQKGTGRARHGDRYAPIFVGGGIAHGPKGVKPKNLVLPKRMKRKALASAVLLKLNENQISALDKLEKLAPKTSTSVKLLAKIASHPKNKVLLITANKQDNLYQATKNLQGVIIKRAALVNTLDLVRADHIIVTKDAFATIKARVSGQPVTSPKPVAKKPIAKNPTAKPKAKKEASK